MSVQDAKRSLMEGLLYSAFFATLLCSISVLPQWPGLALLLLAPVIPAVHAVRQRFSLALGFALLTIASIGMVSDSTLLIAVWLYSVGLGLGWGLKKQLSAPQIDLEDRQALLRSALSAFLPGLCGAMLGTLLLVLWTPSLMGITLLAGVEALLDDSMTITLNGSFDSVEQAQEMVLYLYGIKDTIRDSFLFLLSCTSWLATFLSYNASRFVLRRMGVSLPFLPDFCLWQLPRSSMIVLLVTFIPLLFFEESVHWFIVLLSCINQLILLLCVFLGMAVSDFYFLLWHWPRWLRIMLRPAFFILPFLQSTMLLLGLLDVGFDLRKLERQMTIDK